MTMATDGRQIEELETSEKDRELRLRYVGSLGVLVDCELRTSAARLIAAFPLVTQDSFVDRAREAFRHVVGEVLLGARDARHEVGELSDEKLRNGGKTIVTDEGEFVLFECFEGDRPVGKVAFSLKWSEDDVLMVLMAKGYPVDGIVMFKGWPITGTFAVSFDMEVVSHDGVVRHFRFLGPTNEQR